mgnify:CR=1 FL=1
MDHFRKKNLGVNRHFDPGKGQNRHMFFTWAATAVAAHAGKKLWVKIALLIRKMCKIELLFTCVWAATAVAAHVPAHVWAATAVAAHAGV